MIKKSSLFLLFLIAGIITTSILLFLNCEWEIQKDVLYLKGDRMIVSEETSEGGNLVYYRQDGATRVLPKAEVEHIGYGDITETVTGEEYATCYINLAKEKISEFVRPDARSADREHDHSFDLFKKNSAWLPLLIILPATYLVLRRRRTSRKKQANGKPSTTPSVSDSPATARKKWQDDPEISDTHRIVRFFLELFRLQTGAAPDAVAEMFPVEARTIGSNQIYQLRILHNGEWATRRMSIGSLGEESGSKSKCFYVIYDVHIVIKIPPRPLNDFQAYVDNIKSEAQIVEKLAPKQCIVPKISVILQMVHTFPGEESIPPDKLEEKYIRFLEKRPGFQEYLKIGGRFVFFMDLSKYFFLGHIIDNFHDLSQKINEEIFRNPGMIWDLQGFTGRYGHYAGRTCEKMQELYIGFESEIRSWAAAQDPPLPVQQYQIRQWYLTRLTGSVVNSEEKTLPAELAEKINLTAQALFQQNIEEIARYKKVIHRYVREVTFSQNKIQIENICTNILTLLAWLGKKQIAMRDLKPDNLLVAGDPADYPHFLTAVDKFSIGLIDVETAVDYNESDGRKIPQPQLGGTPNYATTTHLFDNRILLPIYSDLARILHLQDWQATIGMLYKAAMGKTLFVQTGKLFPGIVKTIQQSVATKKPIDSIVKKVSRMFWQRATEDFSSRMQKKAPALQALKLKLPDTVRKMFRQEAMQASQGVSNAIQTYVRKQTAFPGEQNFQRLTAASHKKILAFRLKMEEQGDSLPPDKTEQYKVLQVLERLKHQHMQLTDFLDQLEKPYVTMTVHDILMLMFAVVYNSMHKPEWGPVFPERPGRKKKEQNGA